MNSENKHHCCEDSQCRKDIILRRRTEADIAALEEAILRAAQAVITAKEMNEDAEDVEFTICAERELHFPPCVTEALPNTRYFSLVEISSGCGVYVSGGYLDGERSEPDAHKLAREIIARRQDRGVDYTNLDLVKDEYEEMTLDIKMTGDKTIKCHMGVLTEPRTYTHVCIEYPGLKIFLEHRTNQKDG